MIVKGYRKDADGNVVLQDIFDIIECTYTGKDMGERSITATVTWASPIDFQIGDYVELQMQSLVRSTSGMHGDVEFVEKFYIYTMPTIKKSARAFEHGEGFEHTVTFYPAQHELACVQMRDMGNTWSADSIVYTGFDNVTFYGGAWELMERIMQVLKETYHDSEGNPLWSYEIADAVNEQKNTALERFPFSFSGNSVMDALLKLNDKEGINTTFFINGRKIYVGFKRPYFCRVTDSNKIDSQISTQMFSFKYGRTSDKSIAINHGGLCDITKSVGKELPITKLYAYGASRNLNRYYCSDRLAPGRYVNRLMLPSFSIDGKTDYIISQDSMDRYGVREASKQFEDIYPSLRYMTYGDLRTIKYCIKIQASGLPGEITSHSYDVARVQCYKVVEGDNGVNTLVQAAPPDDLAIYVHAEGKVIRTVLYGGATDAEATAKQKAHDAKVPTDGTNDIHGACFLVDDNGFGSSGSLSRDDWFNDPESGSYTEEQKTEIKLHQIKYTDTFWLTDLYIFHSYDQTYFNKDGYSAWAYPRLNSKYVSENGNIATDSTLVNTILGVEPVTIVDTNMTAAGLDKQQKTFDIYLGDVGFKIDEQNDFGENVFVVAGTVRVSILDGLLAGREFEVNGSVVDSQSICICAFNEDGSLNDEFFLGTDYSGSEVPTRAFNNGAIWRLRLNREYLDEPDYSNLNFAIPNTQINAKAGDHLVLLDIFMPDIYIHAAENRLLHEAQKYLDANDNGSINYSFNFDPVRMLQIPTYALQMREGLNVRMEDGDLDIATRNKVKDLFKGLILTNTSMYETVYNEVPTWYAYEHRGYQDIKDMLSFYTVDNVEYIKNERTTTFLIETNNDGEWEGSFVASINQKDIEDGRDIVLKKNKITVRLIELVQTAYGLERILTNNYITLDATEYSIDRTYSVIRGRFKKNKSTPLQVDTYRYDSKYTYAFDGVAEYDLRSELQEEGIEYEPSTYLAPYGSLVYAPSKLLVEFKACKHYEVSIEANKTALLKTDADGNQSFVLMNNLSGDALIFEPECSIEHTDLGNGFIRFVFDFDLDSSFNDSTLYYPTLVYVSDNQTEYIETRLVSIVESDLEGAIDLPYADFRIDSVTVKITDSSNRANAQPIKEISAVISEQHNATAWASLMNRVEDAEKEGNQNTDAWKEVVQTARRHYQTLLNLRNAIFDPDGSCDQTFLQVMMLQVGADSMNYQLRNTRVGLNENGNVAFFNCSCEYNYNESRYHFVVNGSDELYHFVFVQGDAKGKWSIPLGIDKTLDPNNDGVYEPYFICIRCPKDGGDATWLCETTQHKVNEDNAYWYFNWGILTVDSGGAYTLMETRGNAYMYGDNLVCGKISSLAQNCYFDLTKGDFVLGDSDSGAALSYIDGVLTISGVPDEDSINDMVSKLIGEQTIGGKNLLYQSSFNCDYEAGFIVQLTQILALEGGKTYVASYGKFENNAQIAEEWARGVCLVVSQYPTVESIESVHKFGEPIEINNNGRYLYLAWADYAYVDVIKGTTPSEVIVNTFTQYLDEVMVQEGTAPTSFQPPLGYLIDALTDGTTEIAGGLILTNMLMLKNDNGVISGMSGMKDNSTENYGVSMWAGGGYDDALEQASISSTLRSLPILLTKIGIGSNIGCFEVVSMDEVAIYNSDRESRVLISAIGGIGVSIKLQTHDNGNYIDKVIISDEDIDTSIISKVLIANPNVTTIKDKGAKWTSFDTKEKVVLDGTTNDWTTTMNSGQKIKLLMLISTGLQVNKMRFGNDSYLMFVKHNGGSLYETIWIRSITGLTASSIDYNGYVEFTLPLQPVTEKLGPGTYFFRLIIGSFIRTNSVGTEHTEHTYNNRFTKGSIGFSLIQNVYFTKVSDGDSNVIKIGKDGIKISANSGSNFIAKSTGSDLTVMMNGLPKTAPGVAGSLYVDGNTLKIS